MTIHVNIGEAKSRLSELVAAALRGEEIVLDKAGEPQVRLVPVEDVREIVAKARAEKRLGNLGFLQDKYRGVDMNVPPLMTDEEIDARERRICGSAD